MSYSQVSEMLTFWFRTSKVKLLYETIKVPVILILIKVSVILILITELQLSFFAAMAVPPFLRVLDSLGDDH